MGMILQILLCLTFTAELVQEQPTLRGLKKKKTHNKKPEHEEKKTTTTTTTTTKTTTTKTEKEAAEGKDSLIDEVLEEGEDAEGGVEEDEDDYDDDGEDNEGEDEEDEDNDDDDDDYGAEDELDDCAKNHKEKCNDPHWVPFCEKTCRGRNSSEKVLLQEVEKLREQIKLMEEQVDTDTQNLSEDDDDDEEEEEDDEDDEEDGTQNLSEDDDEEEEEEEEDDEEEDDEKWFFMVVGTQREEGQNKHVASQCVKSDDMKKGGRVQCCKQDGSHPKKNHRPGCKKGQTQEQASVICEATQEDNGESLRLCTKEEILKYKGHGTGCSFDDELVWSSTPCDDVDLVENILPTVSSVHEDASLWGGKFLTQPGHDVKHFWHSEKKTQNWAIVDLPCTHLVKKIKVVNRNDGCCPERLSNVKVLVGDRQCGDLIHGSKPGDVHERTCGFYGSTITLQQDLETPGYLHVHTMQAFGSRKCRSAKKKKRKADYTRLPRCRENNTQFKGTSLGKPFTVDDAETCMKECDVREECAYWTWSPIKKKMKCQFLSKRGKVKDQKGAISGTKKCSVYLCHPSGLNPFISILFRIIGLEMGVVKPNTVQLLATRNIVSVTCSRRPR